MISGECTPARYAGVPPATQALSVARSAASRKPRCESVSRTLKIGARGLAGKVTGIPDGSTHAMAPRNDVALHPAAGDDPPWQRTQCACRIGATSVSKTGADGSSRSTEHPSKSGDEAAESVAMSLRAVPGARVMGGKSSL
jgi:hypothetical protein